MSSLIVGVVVSHRFHIVHPKRSGGQVGLLELNVSVPTAAKLQESLEDNNSFLVSIWGQQASDRFRHIVHLGCLVAVKETQPRRMSQERRMIVTGTLFA